MKQVNTMPKLSPEQMKLLKDGERVDFLVRENRYIIQNSKFFPFSVDAVLLASFATFNQRSQLKIMDFCTGGGIIPLLLSHRTKVKIQAIEIQAEIADMAKRSVQLNRLEDQIEIIQGDLRQLKVTNQFLDVITCNPPYFTRNEAAELHSNPYHAIARHEIHLTLDQWVKKASQLLKQKGKLFIVYRPNRLDDLMMSLLEHRFAIKRLCFVHPKKGENANSVLIEAIAQGGRQGVRVEPAIIVHQDDGSYTPLMQEIYYGNH
ncbi:tRNA1(Val) (adenine(37)-N6)-methyltransferase [Facklamia miroungae]|uniref:tRNA1(Val) A37 N6-methylase TrmN6 n=1 Tax=Facklamia miroungae TaxID=120956 RepID=A0A1G7SMV9_9LACT|nr:tRNA1(Val) (adenine(37)-N6)-methyltransferase [Facklamia miroungae]NKZ29601.1 tRNA1(Val) (adenine(37)-N6)-methyltransferase [Facklamia miroungae]SDG24184.1 tRNA1(Val) A37 N6-methylase TrmN6 [Facklamia miroungae]